MELCYYDMFNEAKSLMTFKPLKKQHGYIKLVVAETADGWFSYNRGMLALKLYTVKNNNAGLFCVRILLATIDDGGYGGWSEEMKTEQEAKDLVEKLKTDVFSDQPRYDGDDVEIYVLPSIDDLNEILRPYGMYVTNEG